MAQELYVITAPSVEDTGKVSFAFMFDSKAKFEDFSHISGRYGLVKLEERGENEIDPFKLARDEPGAVGPNGVKKWRVCTGSSQTGQDYGGNCNETEEEIALQEFLGNMQDAVLLMERSIYDRFEKACQAKGIKVNAHHSVHRLSTSNRSPAAA